MATGAMDTPPFDKDGAIHAEAATAPLSRLKRIESLLDQALQAQRGGVFDDKVRQRPRLVRWLMRRYETVARGTAGEALRGASQAEVAGLLLRWLVTQLRPDAAPHFNDISDDAWLHVAGWRPMLATASVAGFLRIPEFPRQYRRTPGEPALDNLCGLWNVGPSTVYRWLERGRLQMAQLVLQAEFDADRRLSLREWTLRFLQPRIAADDDMALREWHLMQAGRSMATDDPIAPLWHLWRAAEVPAFISALRDHVAELAPQPETEALIDRVAAGVLRPRSQVDLWLARAALARTQNADERERRAYEAAQRCAQASGDRLLLGIAQSALGRYHEPRDIDRALACYQDSAELLRDLKPDSGDEQALEHVLTAFARLAWLYLLRNDPRSRLLLDATDSLRETFRVPDGVLGMLEQVWGEYWHRSGDSQRSLEHRYRALGIFERLGDQRSLMATYVNLVFLHGEAGDLDRAQSCASRVLDAARRGIVEATLQVSTHLNLGAAYFARRDWSAAIEHDAQALQLSLDNGLRVHAFRARYNLAEAHYTRFRDSARTEDEIEGDRHVADALQTPESDSSQAAIESIRRLKSELLGSGRATEPNRLLPAESAVHPEAMAEIQRQRERLSLPGDAATRAGAHLAIARAYYAIATRERDAARELVEAAGIQPLFIQEFAALRQIFERELTAEQQLAGAWKLRADDLLGDAQRAALIAHLLRDGMVNKSRYGELTGVAPATASKHLGLLAARGLLARHGKGPSTHYRLAG